MDQIWSLEITKCSEYSNLVRRACIQYIQRPAVCEPVLQHVNQLFNVNQSSSSNSWWTAPPKLDKLAVGWLVLSHFREVIWQFSVGQSGSCNIFPIDDWVYCHCPNYLYAIVICLSFSVAHISLHIHIIPIRQDKSNQHKTAEKHNFLLVMNL